MKLHLRAIGIMLVLATTALVGCNKAGENTKASASKEQQPPPTVVDVQIVQLGTIPIIQGFSGRVAAVETSEVRPQASGIVDEVLFKEGSFVKKGQELYRLNRDNYVSAANTSMAAIETAQASLVSAKSGLVAQESNLAAQLANLEAQEATLAQARADLARVESLVGIDAVSKQLHDQHKTAVRTAQANVKNAQAGVKTAQANVESAKANIHQAQSAINSAKAAHDASMLDMSRTVIRAPISGKIGISAVTAGALVSASQATPLATISRTDVVYVDIKQSSSELLKLRQQIISGKAGQGTTQVQIVLEDGEIYPIIGQLALSDAKVDSATGSVTIRAVFPNPDGVLIPGMYVNANLAQSVVSNATLLPQSAVTLTPQGEAQVFVVNADKKIEVRTVTTAGTFQGQWVITEGLTDGEAVVVMGGTKVKPDQAVEVRVLPPAGGQPSEEGETDSEQAPQEETPSAPQAPQAPAPAGQNSVMAPPSQTQSASSSSEPARPTAEPRATPPQEAVSPEQAEAEAMADDTPQPQAR